MSNTTPNDDDDQAAGDEERGALADRAKRMLDRDTNVASGVTGAIVGAAEDTSESEPAGDSNASDDAATPGLTGGGIVSGTSIVSAATTSVPPAPAGGGGGPGGSGGSGSGGSGSGGSGSGGSGSDDEGAFIPGIGVSGTNQVIVLGLVVAVFMLFGSAIWSFIGGDDDTAGLDSITAPFDDAVDSATDGPCADLRQLLEDDSFDREVSADVRCRRIRDRLRLTGEVASTDIAARVGTLAAAIDPDLELDNRLTVADPVESGDGDDGDESVAAAETSTAPTTEAETTTTETPPTTEAESTTTTEAETTTTAEPAFTLLTVVSEGDDTSEFARLAGLLGLQDALDDVSVERTLFVPSNDAIDQFDQSVLAEAGAGERIVGYHIVEGTLMAADLIALDTQEITTTSGLPIKVSVVDGIVTLNDTAAVVGADRQADNGVVHVIDQVLEAPTLNEALGLNNIAFEVNSAVITAEGQAELQNAVAFFTDNPDARASIEGHTDTDGSAELNQTLSEDRAAAVKDFLVAAGLEADRFTTAGFGETRPILDEQGVENKDASRRIEFILQ